MTIVSAWRHDIASAHAVGYADGMADDSHDDPSLWLLTDDLPCLGCQYNLRGLVGPIVACPECGHHNDLRQAHLWNIKKIPTGVRIREHWPTSAVVWSLMAPFSYLGAHCVFTSIFGVAGIFALFAGVVIVVWFCIWMAYCIKWINHCNHKAWAVTLLLLLHVCTWGFLAAPVLAAYYADGSGNLEWSFFLLIPLAVGLILIIRSAIHRADREGQFRGDWKAWRVPVAAEPSKNEVQ